MALTDFCDLDGDGISEILIGWEIYGTSEMQMAVYSFKNDELNRRMLQQYTHFLCGDIDEDGNNEVTVIMINSGGTPNTATVYRLNENGVTALYSAELDRGTKTVNEPVYAHLSSGKPAIYIDEIKGVYVPFWLFDGQADADISYHATRVRRWSDSKNDYTETSHYSVYRGGDLSFAKVPVDGSSQMPDDLMESIEPFNFSEAVDFQTAYLAGYLADKYDVDAAQSVDRANQRIKNTTEHEFAKTVVGYDSVVPENSSVRISGGKAKYALYPVWILNTTYNGQKYIFAMNGQTGKFVGNLPLDKGAFAKWWALVGAISAAAAFAIGYLIWLI